MPGFLSLFEGTVIVDATTGREVSSAARPEWWVELTKTLSQGDYEKAQRFIVGDSTVQAKQGEEADATYLQRTDILGYQRALVEAALVDWNLTDEHGDRLPCANLEDRKRSLAKLPPGVFMGLYGVVSEYNQPRTPGEAATFPAGSGASGEDGSEGDRSVGETPAGDVDLQEARPD